MELQSFEGLSPDSRVWIFQSERELTVDEMGKIRSVLSPFVLSWTSHNRALKAACEILYNRLIVIALDQSASSAASGCSIDSMTHHIQDIATSIGVDLMDRTTFYFILDDGIKSIKMNDLGPAYQDGQVSDHSKVIDPLVQKLSQISDNLVKPLSTSWHYRFV